MLQADQAESAALLQSLETETAALQLDLEQTREQRLSALDANQVKLPPPRQYLLKCDLPQMAVQLRTLKPALEAANPRRRGWW